MPEVFRFEANGKVIEKEFRDLYNAIQFADKMWKSYLISRPHYTAHPCPKCKHSLLDHTNGTYIVEGKCKHCNCNLPRQGTKKGKRNESKTSETSFSR